MSKFSQIARSFVAAVTSPTAVKQEKSLVVFIAVRVLLAAGASDGVVQLVQLIGKV